MTLLTHLTLALAGLALAGDVWSTERAMATGLTHEANRIMAYVMRRLGRTAALLITHVGAFVVLLLLGQWPANILVVVVFGYVTWHNLNLRALRQG